MPPLPDFHCRYVSEWVATKLRWDLTADQAETAALTVYAEARETTVVHYTPAVLRGPASGCVPAPGITGCGGTREAESTTSRLGLPGSTAVACVRLQGGVSVRRRSHGLQPCTGGDGLVDERAAGQRVACPRSEDTTTQLVDVRLRNQRGARLCGLDPARGGLPGQPGVQVAAVPRGVRW